MTTADLVSEAVDELYTADPEAFTERRAALAAQARAAGDAAAARGIAKLRKPTRSAWAINQVVRADPSIPARLASLGDQLRAAERSMDGPKIRELSLARRQLIDALVADTLAASGQQPPPAALREEVTSTFGAALADRQFAEQLASGILLRAERRAGFGSGTGADLLLVKPPSGTAPAPAAKAGTATTRTATTRTATTRTATTRTATTRTAARADQASLPATEPPPARTRAAPGKARTAATGKARTAAAGRLRAAEAAAEQKARAAAEKARERAAARAREERERQQVIADTERAVAEAGQALTAATTAERGQEAAVRRLEEQLAEARLRLSELRLQARRAKADQRKARDRLDQLRR